MNVSTRFRQSIAELQDRIREEEEFIVYLSDIAKKFRKRIREATPEDQAAWERCLERVNAELLADARAGVIQLTLAVDSAREQFADACQSEQESRL